MNLAARGEDVGLEELEIEVEMLEGVVLDQFADAAQRLELGEPLDGEPAALGKPALHQRQCPLQDRVGKAGAGVRLERTAGREHVFTAEGRSAGLPRSCP